MTISPWAMLMTPMVPNVIERPMAASRRTEPRDTPYQTFWTAFQSASLLRMPSAALAAASATSAGVPVGRFVRSARASWLPRAFNVSMAEIFSGAEASALLRRIAARAFSRATFTLPSPSFAMACSRVGKAAASRERKTARAASRRVPASELSRVMLPSAASTARRTRLLSRTGLAPAAGSAAWPVAASTDLPAASRM